MRALLGPLGAFFGPLKTTFGSLGVIFEFPLPQCKTPTSLQACASMVHTKLADQPYSAAVITQGESVIREGTTTFTTLSPMTSFLGFAGGSDSAFCSSRFVLTTSSSQGRPTRVRKGGEDTAAIRTLAHDEILLALDHAVHVLRKRSVPRVRRVGARQHRDHGAVGSVRVYTQLEACAALL